MAVVTFRTDEQTDEALAMLTADGTSVSEAIRRALADALRQERRRQMREEALRDMADPEYVAESRRLLEEMEQLRAR
jgi:Arc/MetJ-type ribon-helix-helix transcriptional regulator